MLYSFVLIEIAVIVAVGIYLLVLITRFVKAHQKGAQALTMIAEKIEMRDQTRNS